MSTTWNLVHPHDFFIAGFIVGVLFSAWVGLLIAMFIEFCKPLTKPEDSDKV